MYVHHIDAEERVVLPALKKALSRNDWQAIGRSMAERRGLASDAYPSKGFYYLGGLTEASETLICFVLMCLWPDHFAWWAYGFAALCGITVATRIVGGAKVLSR